MSRPGVFRGPNRDHHSFPRGSFGVRVSETPPHGISRPEGIVRPLHPTRGFSYRVYGFTPSLPRPRGLLVPCATGGQQHPSPVPRSLGLAQMPHIQIRKPSRGCSCNIVKAALRGVCQKTSHGSPPSRSRGFSADRMAQRHFVPMRGLSCDNGGLTPTGLGFLLGWYLRTPSKLTRPV